MASSSSPLENYSQFGYNTDISSGYNPSATPNTSRDYYNQITADRLGIRNNGWNRLWNKDFGDSYYESWRDSINNRYSGYLSAYNKAYDDLYNTPLSQLNRRAEAGYNPFFNDGGSLSPAASAAGVDLKSTSVSRNSDNPLLNLLDIGQFALQFASRLADLRSKQLDNQFKAETMPTRIDLSGIRRDSAKEGLSGLNLRNNLFYNRLFGNSNGDFFQNIVAPGTYYNLNPAAFFMGRDLNELSFGRSNISGKDLSNQIKQYQLDNVLPAMTQLYKDSHKLNSYPLKFQKQLSEHISDLIDAYVNENKYKAQYYDKVIPRLDSWLSAQGFQNWVQPINTIVSSASDVIRDVNSFRSPSKGTFSDTWYQGGHKYNQSYYLH